MDLDAVLLARIQFAFTISFHIIFPSFTIGLAAFIATLLVRWRMTGRDHLHRLARFWTKIFAVSFAMGVVSGIVLSYQFGTNWSNFSVVVGNVLGPLLGYEVLTAFFLEATFLGIMLFGWQRVSPNLHVLSAVLVAIGTSLSAFWILAANSWMQTPAGHEVRDGIAYPVDWIAIIFNPSFPYRFAHMFTAAYLTTSLVVLAVGRALPRQGALPRGGQDHDAHGARHGRHPRAAAGVHRRPARPQHRRSISRPRSPPSRAHWDGIKAGAARAVRHPQRGARSRTTSRSPSRICASLILTHSADGLFKGLKEFAPADRPPVFPVFFAFRLMVGLGVLMIAIGFVGAYLWFRGRLFDTRWYLQPVQYVMAARLHRHSRRLVRHRDRPTAVDRRTASCARPMPRRRSRFGAVLLRS